MELAKGHKRRRVNIVHNSRVRRCCLDTQRSLVGRAGSHNANGHDMDDNHRISRHISATQGRDHTKHTGAGILGGLKGFAI